MVFFVNDSMNVVSIDYDFKHYAKKIHQTQISANTMLYDDFYNHLDNQCLLFCHLGPLVDNANAILHVIFHGTNTCKNIEGNLIDRNIVNQKLLFSAKDINNVVDIALRILKQNREYDVPKHEVLEFNMPAIDSIVRYKVYPGSTISKYCAQLKNQALTMIFKSVWHGEHTNEKLLLLASRFDAESNLNVFPDELINLFVMKMFEVKLNAAKTMCNAI